MNEGRCCAFDGKRTDHCRDGSNKRSDPLRDISEDLRSNPPDLCVADCHVFTNPGLQKAGSARRKKRNSLIASKQGFGSEISKFFRNSCMDATSGSLLARAADNTCGSTSGVSSIRCSSWSGLVAMDISSSAFNFPSAYAKPISIWLHSSRYSGLPGSTRRPIESRRSVNSSMRSCRACSTGLSSARHRSRQKVRICGSSVRRMTLSSEPRATKIRRTLCVTS